MHITASVFINDHERGLHADYEKWLEALAPARLLIDWGEAYLARGEPGDRERAEELLRDAEAEFGAMGAPLYAERAGARLEDLAAR